MSWHVYIYIYICIYSSFTMLHSVFYSPSVYHCITCTCFYGHCLLQYNCSYHVHTSHQSYQSDSEQFTVRSVAVHTLPSLSSPFLLSLFLCPSFFSSPSPSTSLIYRELTLLLLLAKIPAIYCQPLVSLDSLMFD